MIVGACGGAPAPATPAPATPAPATPTGETPAAQTPASETPPGGEALEIVWLEQGAGNPYWDAQHAAAEQAGNRLGFSFRAVSGNLDPASQAATLQQLVDQGVSVIMLNAIDPVAIQPALQYANERGVPVVNLYGIEENATASVTFDEVEVGEVAARQALTILEQRYGGPEGTVGVLTGIQGQPASDQRAQGFTDFMAQQAGVEVVAVQPTQWAADAASATMQDWLTAYPDLSMVYTLSDTLAVPAMNVAERQGRLCTQEADWTQNENCVIFVSVDGIFLDEVVGGRLYATQLYSPEWSGFQFATVAHQVATGADFPTETTLRALLVTPDNAECVADMQSEMAADLADFPYEGSLQDIAASRGCAVLDE